MEEGRGEEALLKAIEFPCETPHPAAPSPSLDFIPLPFIPLPNFPMNFIPLTIIPLAPFLLFSLCGFFLAFQLLKVKVGYRSDR